MTPPEQRTGLDRREDADGITIGEVYRICQRIDLALTGMQKDTENDLHSLRGKCQEHAIAIALLKKVVEDVKAKAETRERDWRGWIASGLIGAFVAVVPLVIVWVMNHR